MTILEASGKLIEFFIKNDNFELETNFKQICLISDTDADKAAILLALDELTKQNIVIKKEFDSKTYWILTKPMLYQQQTVSFNVLTGLEIANILNQIEPPDGNRCNPLNIDEEDINGLIMLIKGMAQSDEQQPEKD